jgi:hypothetical protein
MTFFWLQTVYQRIEQGDAEEAVDILYDCIDDLALNDQFDDIDELFTRIDLTKMNTEAILAVLTITLAGTKILKGRTAFCEQARTRLQELGHTEDTLASLLKGLNAEPSAMTLLSSKLQK